MPVINNKTTKEKIEEIQNIYDLFINKLNKLKIEKNEIVNNVIQRIDEQKIAEKLKDLKDRY